jgi:hypothetical protein
VVDEARQLYGFERFDDASRLLVVLNNSPDEQQTLVGCETAGWRDLLTGEAFTVNGDRLVSLTVPPRWGRVLDPIPISGE